MKRFLIAGWVLLATIQGSAEVIPIVSPVEIKGNVTFPATSKLDFQPGGAFVIAPGVTVRIEGELTAGEQPIFQGAGAVSGPVKTAAVYPQWFGAKGDGVADDAPALQKAADLAQHSSSKKLVIPKGCYRLESSLQIRCNVDCSGTLRKVIEIDEKRNSEFPGTYMPMYFPRKDVLISIVPDEDWIELDPRSFEKVEEGAFRVPIYTGIVAVNNADHKIDLLPGGTLWLESSDFFTSRNNVKGDEFYTKNDVCAIASAQGDVFPEFIFDYRPPAAKIAPWNNARNYSRGDYCTVNSQLYKSTYPSGPESKFVHRFKGTAQIGPHSPASGERKEFQYPDGQRDSIRLWTAVKTRAYYLPPQTPLTIKGLQLEISSIDPQNRVKPIRLSNMSAERSNVTFNQLQIRCSDANSLLSSLLRVKDCTDVVFNECSFSGATFHGLGYNISNSNAANIVYNHCTSVNARKGMAGRHGKNISVNGGHYNLIDDHYGANYVIRDASISGMTTFVPGYKTPKADVEKWSFVPGHALVFCGKNFSVSDCRIENATGVFTSRPDVGDCYGTISLRNITISAANKPVMLFRFVTSSTFDYAHQIKVPSQVSLENITIQGQSGSIEIKALNNAPRFPLSAVNCSPLNAIAAFNADLTFRRCLFPNARFTADRQSVFSFIDNEFKQPPKGLPPKQIILN